MFGFDGSEEDCIRETVWICTCTNTRVPDLFMILWKLRFDLTLSYVFTILITMIFCCFCSYHVLYALVRGTGRVSLEHFLWVSKAVHLNIGCTMFDEACLGGLGPKVF